MYPTSFYPGGMPVPPIAVVPVPQARGVFSGTIYSTNARGSGFFHPHDDPNLTIFIPPHNMNGAVQDATVEVQITGRNEKGFVGQVIPMGKVIRTIEVVSPTPQIGVIDTLNENGSGFCKSDSETSLIYISPQQMQDSSLDDTVEFKVVMRPEFPSCPVGKILRIVQRARSELACVVFPSDHQDVMAYSPLLKRNIRLTASEDCKHMQPGERVVCRVSRWNHPSEDIQAVALSRIGHLENPTQDIVFFRMEYQLPGAFSDEIVKEVANILSLPGGSVRHNFLHWKCISIDGPNTSCFDDAMSLDQNELGFLLGVHVIDVSYFVRPGSAIDKEARRRCQSIYFPGHCIPMLPDDISRSVCSLVTSSPRFVVSVLIQFTSAGHYMNHQIVRSIIVNQCNLIYDQALAMLQDTTSESPCRSLLVRMARFAQLLHLARNAPPPVEISSSYHIVHQIVEEFMLQANTIVAQELAHQHKLAPYRVSVDGHSAHYSTNMASHHGLSVSQYCHFTSPVRRYVDLVIHRLLFEQDEIQDDLDALT